VERVNLMQIAVIRKEECTDEEYDAAETAGHLIAADHAVLSLRRKGRGDGGGL